MIETTKAIDSNENKQSGALPFKNERAPKTKIIGILILIFIIVLANYFIFKLSGEKTAEKKDSDTYDTSYLNAVPKPNVEISPHINPKTDTDVLAEQNAKQAIAEIKAKDFVERLQASQNSSGGASYSSGNHAVGAGASANGENANNGIGQARINDPNTAFLVQVSNSKAEHEYATHFGAMPYMIGQGKFIFGTLATAINSDLPGQITANVSQDVYGEQGRKILIPKGSLLIGEYKSGLANNQSRLFVVWTRLREPNGIDVMLGSEGTDSLGRAGLTGDVDYHFFARFGAATLIAMIGAGASTVGVNPNDQYNSASVYRQNVSQALAQQASNTLIQGINIPPTINIHQGTPIVVFVNRDLDFSRVYR